MLFAVRLLIYSTTAFFTLLCLASIAVARRAGMRQPLAERDH